MQEDNKTIKDKKNKQKKGQKNLLSTDKISFYQNESQNLNTDSNKFPLQHQRENYKLKHCIYQAFKNKHYIITFINLTMKLKTRIAARIVFLY